LSAMQPRRAIIIVACAAVAAPLIAIVFFVLDLMGDEGNIVAQVVVPAAIGALVGTLMIAVRRVRTAGTSNGRRSKTLTITAIFAVALLGTFSSHMPRWFDALLTGWVIGFFLAFDVLLVLMLRSDLEFRKRITGAFRETTQEHETKP
jgi:chromate transport protein ChrA